MPRKPYSDSTVIISYYIQLYWPNILSKDKMPSKGKTDEIPLHFFSTSFGFIFNCLHKVWNRASHKTFCLCTISGYLEEKRNYYKYHFATSKKKKKLTWYIKKNVILLQFISRILRLWCFWWPNVIKFWISLLVTMWAIFKIYC